MTGGSGELTRQWAAALDGVIVRHPNRGITPLLTLEDGAEPNLYFKLDSNPSSDADEVISPFVITNVRLSFFPGVRAARAWLAAAWACFLQHEALELVTVGDLRTRVLDPHATRQTLDYVFHTGLPFALTPESLLAALMTAVPRDEALQIMEDR